MKPLNFAISLLLVLSCSSLRAQSAKMQASIPFDFYAGKTLMSAGDYEVDYSASGVLQFRGRNGVKSAAYFLTIPESRSVPPAPNASMGILQFNHYGETYFLSQIWPARSTTGGALPRSPREKEIASRGTPVQTAGVLLSTH